VNNGWKDPFSKYGSPEKLRKKYFLEANIKEERFSIYLMGGLKNQLQG